eukprot:TRINITY_DN5186_c0_g1_i2.p1 TRINITY_DN5186_c0_g1~~TRINITY_DN5186_c0_g1_i2.p1  ORF type:complete len:222 (+),score=34.39 TRINITY_DN5186_c0_g1_i2:61-666(+)
MEAREYEFMAENEKVTILPKFNHPTFTLIQGDYGPFKAGNQIEVPLWLAVMLRQSDKCSIETPEWMDVEILEKCRDDEKEEGTFTKLPAKFIFEVANILFDVTAASIVHADQIRSVLKEIFDIRQSKLRKSIDKLITDGYLYAKINYLQEIELANFRPILPHAFDYIQRLDEATEVAKLIVDRSIQQSSMSIPSSFNNSTF